MADFKEISAQELKEKLDRGDDFTLVNVLSASSFEAMHIPGSINIDVSRPNFLDKVHEIIPDKNKDIVVYCSSATCQSSPAAARKLVEDGYTNIIDYPGGLAGWKEAGFQLEGVMAE